MAHCLQTVVPHSNYTGGIQLFPAVFSRWATPQYHHIRKLCCIALFELPGLVVGRTLVDPSKWKVPVLGSDFSQETIVVTPFTEVGMITQVTAIQSVADTPLQSQNTTKALPRHLQDLVEQTCRDMDPTQRHRLATVLSEYSDIFPVPGAPFTGDTDAVEHDINTGDRPPIHCAPRRMSPHEKGRGMRC